MRSGRIAIGLAAVVAAMLAASFAAVPFYDWFCRVTGYEGTPGVASAPLDEPVDRLVTVRFDANTAPGMPWEFAPRQRTMQLRVGETGLAFYEAHNPTQRLVAGQASYNVTPFAVGGYFDKIACFCFDLQVLGPGERIEMPVSFYVDPAMLADAEARGVTEITLSYTMYPADLPDQAAADASARVAAGPAGRATIER